MICLRKWFKLLCDDNVVLNQLQSFIVDVAMKVVWRFSISFAYLPASDFKAVVIYRGSNRISGKIKGNAEKKGCNSVWTGYLLTSVLRQVIYLMIMSKDKVKVYCNIDLTIHELSRVIKTVSQLRIVVSCTGKMVQHLDTKWVHTPV